MFKFEPSSILIGPSDQQQFAISTTPTKIMLRQDVFLIDAVIGTNSRKQLFETSVRINVVNPTLKWSKNQIVFEVFYGRDSKLWGEFFLLFVFFLKLN